MIDLHAHVMLESALGAAGEFGPWLERTADGVDRFRVGTWTLEGVAYRDSPFMDVDRRLERMAETGIVHQVLSPNPLLWFHHIPAADAVTYCRVHNEELAALVGGRPDRLSGLAQLPMQDPSAAADELHRAIALGLVGGAFGTELRAPVDDRSFDPVWGAAQDLGVPLFAHPAPPGIDGPPDPRGMRRGFELHGGFAADETRLVWDLVSGDVLDRFPRLDLVISHGGGAMPMLAGRWRHAMATRPEGSGSADDLDRRLGRLWFDTHVGSEPAAAALAATVGTERLLFGTNFAGWDECTTPPDVVSRSVLDTNARRLVPTLSDRLPGSD